MADETRKPPPPSSPASLPPEVPVELDSSWDDDTMPRLELDDPMSESAFDRVTAIPELPPEMFAKQVMSGQVDTAPPPTRPAAERRADLSLSLGPSPHQTSSPTSATARPGRHHVPRAEAPQRSQPDAEEAPATARAPAPVEPSRDARYPLLELDLDDIASSVPPPAPVPSPPATPRERQLTELKDRYAMGDFTGALSVAEGLLEQDADDRDAQRYAQSCRDVLTQMYSARLGSLTQRVRVAVPGDQIRWLSLDHRAGFVLSLIDGSSTVEELLDISGMNRLDALRILYTLFDQRVIALG